MNRDNSPTGTGTACDLDQRPHGERPGITNARVCDATEWACQQGCEGACIELATRQKTACPGSGKPCTNQCGNVCLPGVEPTSTNTKPTMKRIYISGPMSGLPDLNFPAFHTEALRLRALGYDAVNPAEINVGESDWHTCLKTDLRELLTCDTVALLPGWHDSKGAHLEVHVAHRVGISVIDAKNIQFSAQH